MILLGFPFRFVVFCETAILAEPAEENHFFTFRHARQRRIPFVFKDLDIIAPDFLGKVLCHLWIQKTAHLRSLAAAFFEEVLQDGAAFGFKNTGLYFGAVIEIGMVQDRKD